MVNKENSDKEKEKKELTKKYLKRTSFNLYEQKS